MSSDDDLFGDYDSGNESPPEPDDDEDDDDFGNDDFEVISRLVVALLCRLLQVSTFFLMKEVFRVAILYPCSKLTFKLPYKSK